MPGKKANEEANEADYISRQPEPPMTQDSGADRKIVWTDTEDAELL